MTANDEADFRAVLSTRRLVLDGGLSTELERRGSDVSGRLWSAQLLAEDPAAIRSVHAAFLAAGADVITTASYQAGLEGLVSAGFTPGEAADLLRRSVRLARQAVQAQDRTAWVAGSVGPYGAMLADGSEYTGDYGDTVTVAGLRAFHRPRLEILAAAGVDVLAVETVPILAEAAAVTAELDRLGVPAWLSLTTVTGPDGVVRTRRGEPADEAWATAAGVDAIVAVGVNCVDPDGVAAAVEVAAKASGKPVVAYPNSGEGWDAVHRRWTGTPTSAWTPTSICRPNSTGPSAITSAGLSWFEAGAHMVGGCCRVTPEMIAELSRAVHPKADDGDDGH